MYLISGCLLGNNCKYNGGNNLREWVKEFAETHDYMVVCPETAGKLPVPRPPAERVGDRILDKEGKDVTSNFEEGARISLEKAIAKAKEEGKEIEGAILKAKSPSCGVGKIYDGTFTGTLVLGDGVFTKLLKERGIPVYTEEDKL